MNYSQITILLITTEIVFILSYLLIYFIVGLLRFVYSLIHLKNRYIWMIDGVISGFGAMVSLFVFSKFLITKFQLDFNEITIIIISLILPVIGELEYILQIGRGKKVRYIGRLHLAIKNFIRRGEFASLWVSNLEKLDTEGLIRFKDGGDEEKRDFARNVNEETEYVMVMIFMWSVLGYILGLLFVLFYLFK